MPPSNFWAALPDLVSGLPELPIGLIISLLSIATICGMTWIIVNGDHSADIIRELKTDRQIVLERSE